jgi:hypothetical protein
VVAVAGALNASEDDQRLAAFYAEQLQRAPVERGGDAERARRSSTAAPGTPRTAPRRARLHRPRRRTRSS